MNDRQQNDRSPDTRALYAWLSRDLDGIEGIIVAPVGPLGVVPLVSADLRVAYQLHPLAQQAARERHFPAVLVRFERAENITTVDVPPPPATKKEAPR